MDPDLFEELNDHRWLLGAGGYAMRYTKGPHRSRQALLMHRSVLGLPAYGPPKVRFLNRNPLDNRRANLALSRRWVTQAACDDPAIMQTLLARLTAVPVAA
ncbi:MAG: hypothetical protein M3P85_13835 [Actinomycetota bacterium]|nr:hypothetical protein [Actinomycetota bacterium]